MSVFLLVSENPHPLNVQYQTPVHNGINRMTRCRLRKGTESGLKQKAFCHI